MTKKGFKFKPITSSEILATYASALMGNKNLDIGASHQVTNNLQNLPFHSKVPNDIVVGDKFGAS